MSYNNSVLNNNNRWDGPLTIIGYLKTCVRLLWNNVRLPSEDGLMKWRVNKCQVMKLRYAFYQECTGNMHLYTLRCSGGQAHVHMASTRKRNNGQVWSSFSVHETGCVWWVAKNLTTDCCQHKSWNKPTSWATLSYTSECWGNSSTNINNIGQHTCYNRGCKW